MCYVRAQKRTDKGSIGCIGASPLMMLNFLVVRSICVETAFQMILILKRRELEVVFRICAKDRADSSLHIVRTYNINKII